MGESTKRPTRFFLSNSDEITKETTNQIMNSTHNIKIKIIFELDGFIVDLQNKTLYTNIVVRHIRIPNPHKPHKIELVDYSFIDSDNESTKINIDEVTLNPNTEPDMEPELELKQEPDFLNEFKQINEHTLEQSEQLEQPESKSPESKQLEQSEQLDLQNHLNIASDTLNLISASETETTKRKKRTKKQT
jgi:hypothetical protein